MNGINSIHTPLIWGLRWLILSSILSILSACGSGGDENNPTSREIDTQTPSITIIGDLTITLILGDVYTELGAIAHDQEDGEISIAINGNVDTTVVGTYEVTYTAIDETGNTTSTTRIIHVLEPDITSPVLSLIGSSPLLLNQGDIYVEYRASAFDERDGLLDVSISGSVNTNVPGTYMVDYSAQDKAGNSASVTRTVVVLDVTPPVITLNGQSKVLMNEGSVYSEQGAVAIDAINGPVKVAISGSVTTENPGSYTITYSALDAAGNQATITRTVVVLDTTAPVITLIGDNPYKQDEDTDYVEPGFSAIDNSGETINVIAEGHVNSSTPGTYELTYRTSDSSGNTSTASRTVIVSDITPPVITLAGDNPYKQNEDTDYLEPGFSAIDNSGETINVVVEGHVDSSTPGTYELTYKTKDSSDNTSSATRIVNILDTTPPVLTLIGGANIDIPFGSEFNDPGVTSSDNDDTSLIIVNVLGEVNTNTIGTYTLVYSAVDDSKNEASIERVVSVIDLAPPIISLIGGDMSINLGEDFSDPGASANDDVDGIVSVDINGSVNSNEIGTYTLIYSATDSSGNQSSLVRIVTVRDPDQFITIWKTDNEGFSLDNQIKITTSTSDQNYAVNWGDGSNNTGVNGDITHTYENAGTYKVSISGNFKNIKLGGIETDNKKLLSIEQWGKTQWTTMAQAFSGCENLVYNASDAPDLSGVKSMHAMFSGATLFDSNLNKWDVSNVTDMSDLFNGAVSFNNEIDSWKVDSVVDMSNMFRGAKKFNEFIYPWDVDNVKDMSHMFFGAESFNREISDWNVESVETMEGMFLDAISFNRRLSNWDVSNVKKMRSMFKGASSFNQDISNWNVSSVTDMVNMFSYTEQFNQDIGNWDVSSAIYILNMFDQASSFNQDLGRWDLSSVRYMNYMFVGAPLSTKNYDSLLQGWSSQALPNGVIFPVNLSTYSSSSESARNILINTYDWKIYDAGLATQE